MNKGPLSLFPSPLFSLKSFKTLISNKKNMKLYQDFARWWESKFFQTDCSTKHIPTLHYFSYFNYPTYNMPSAIMTKLAKKNISPTYIISMKISLVVLVHWFLTECNAMQNVTMLSKNILYKSNITLIEDYIKQWLFLY